MSTDNRDDIDNLHKFITHLGNSSFSGVLVVSFNKGQPTSLSRKEEFDPEGLDRFLHRPIVVRKKAVDSKPAQNGATETKETVPNES